MCSMVMRRHHQRWTVETPRKGENEAILKLTITHSSIGLQPNPMHERVECQCCYRIAALFLIHMHV